MRLSYNRVSLQFSKGGRYWRGWRWWGVMQVCCSKWISWYLASGNSIFASSAVCWSVMTRERHCWWVIHTALLSNCHLNTKHCVNVIFNFECPDRSLEFKHRISLQNTLFSEYHLQYYFVKQLVRSWLGQLERWHRLCVERNVTGSSHGI